MENNIEYKKYKALKSKFDFTYKSFRISQILAIKIWFWANNGFFLKYFIKGFWQSYNIEKLKKLDGEYVLYMACTERKDHNTTFETIANKVKDKYIVINNSKRNDLVCSSFSIKNVLFSFFFIVKYIGLFHNPYKIIIMAACLCRVLNTIDKLEKISYKHVKRFVAFSAVHEEENVVAQAFRLNGCEVYSLCHGFHFIYKKNIPVDCINYENLDVDKVLVWCDNNRKEYIEYGMEEANVHVVGYPKHVEIKSLTNTVPVKRCLILLSRSQYEGSNNKLISILRNFSDSYEFYLKLHPSLDWNKYERIAKECGLFIVDKNVLLTDCMDTQKFDFAIAINTTSYYEIMIAGIPCLRFKDGDVFDLMPGEDSDIISNQEDFKRSVDWINENLSNSHYSVIRDNMLTRFLGVGIDNYRTFLLN